MAVFPGPGTGTFFAFGKGAICRFLCTDQFHISVIDFRCLIHQLEDTSGAGQSHNNGVHLLGNLSDRVGKRFTQLQETGDHTNGDISNMVVSKNTADNSQNDILEVAQVIHDRHQNIGKTVGIGGIAAQFFIQAVKGFFGTLLIIKDLYNFLPINHLFNVTIGSTQGFLLFDKVTATVAGNFAGNLQHKENGDSHNKGKINTGSQHSHCNGDNRYSRREHLG